MHPGQPNVICRVERYYDESGAYAGIKASIPGGEINYRNPLMMKNSGPHYFREYGVCVAGHLVDFALAVRGLKRPEFDDERALMSMMMEVAARESAFKDGAWINLPLDSATESDAMVKAKLEQELGADPMDVEAMLAYKHDKP